MRSNKFRKFFEEHGIVMSVLNVKPIPVYMNGLHRHLYHARTKEDFFQKELQFIGQQEVLNQELYYDSANADGENLNPFGYQDRYDDYRRQPSGVHGSFRSSLNFWHMARDFASRPALNETFTDCFPTNRIYADQTSTEQLWIMANHSIQARRMVAKSGGTSFIK